MRTWALAIASATTLMVTPGTVEKHLVGVCRHSNVLLAAMLRTQGVPARARCGFAGYFTPGKFEDHWVCEYWDAAEKRWILVDAQIDALQREKLRALYRSDKRLRVPATVRNAVMNRDDTIELRRGPASSAAP